MVGVAHFPQGFAEPVDHSGGDHVVGPFGDPAPGLLRHMPDDGRLVALQRRIDKIEALVEQRLTHRSESPRDASGAAGTASIPRRAARATHSSIAAFGKRSSAYGMARAAPAATARALPSSSSHRSTRPTKSPGDRRARA